MFSFVSFDVYVSFKLIHHMRRGVAESVPWVGKAAGRRGCHGIDYMLAQSAHDHAFAILAGAYPAYVVAVNHIRYILCCLCLPR